MVKCKKQKVRSWKPKIIEAILKRDMPRQELIKHIGANTVGAIAKSLKELIEEEIILEIECSFDKPYCTNCIEFKKNRKIGKFKHKKRGIRAKCLKFNAKVETIKKISKSYPRIFEENLENFVESEELIEDMWKHIKNEFMPEVDPTLLRFAGELAPMDDVLKEYVKRRFKRGTTTRTARIHEPSPAVKKILSFIENNLKVDASAILLLRSKTFPQMLKSSKSFFKLFVIHSAEQIVNSYHLFYMYATSQGISKRRLHEMTNTPIEKIRFSEEFFWELFKHSVLSDILNGEVNEDALKLLERNVKLRTEILLDLYKK